MRISRAFCSLVLLAVLPPPALSAIRPSFSLDYSSWHATAIALVVNTPLDGVFEVVQSWKGDLRVGERLVIPELGPAANAVPISRYPKSWSEAVGGGVSELIPREPAVARMMLFLKSSADREASGSGTGGTERRGWKPSDIMDNMRASTVWIDGDQLFCFTQHMNPGSSVLFMLPDSEETLRDRVAEINGIQETLMAAAEAKHGRERAVRLKPYVLSNVFPAQRFALEELGKSGPAVQTILGIFGVRPLFLRLQRRPPPILAPSSGACPRR